MKAELLPAGGGLPIPITKDLTVIGRRDVCDIAIADPSLSKRHCVVVRTDGLLMIRDLASTNGTKVNGQKILWAALLPNDRVTLGRFKFRVYLGPDDAPSPSEQRDRRQPGLGRPSILAKPIRDQRGPVVESNGFATPSPLSVPVVSNQTPVQPARPVAVEPPRSSTEVDDDDLDLDLEILESDPIETGEEPEFIIDLE